MADSQAWALDLLWSFENDRLNAFMLHHFLFGKLKEFPPFNCQDW